MPSNEYMREYMKRRYHQRRAKAFEILGNKCTHCGSTDKLEIDHINPKDKLIPLNKLWNIMYGLFIDELKVCQLLCKSCHKQKSDAELRQ